MKNPHFEGSRIRLVLAHPDVAARCEHRSHSRAELRQTMRELAYKSMLHGIHHHTAYPTKRAFAETIHRETEFSVAIKPTLSSIRDYMDLHTLLWIAESFASDDDSPFGDVMDVIAGACIFHEKTNGAFGHPSFVPDDYADTRQKDYLMGIKDILMIFDYITVTHEVDPERFFAALGERYSDDDAKTARDIVRRRSTPSNPIWKGDLSGEAKLMAENLISHINDDDKDDDTKEPETMTETTGETVYEAPDGEIAGLINMTLRQAGLPEIDKLVGEINTLSKTVTDLEKKTEAASAVSLRAPVVESTPAINDIPAGTTAMVPATEAMGISSDYDAFDFEVPVWTWEHDHPHVPAVDPSYVFKPAELLRVLYAIVTGERAYLHGHTGTGKTTVIEQVAARLNWPVMRVNFDSEITRMDLIGRDVLSNDEGATTSTFVDGVLPTMLSGPYIGIFDEIDFVRPDVAYVMQRALEGNGLVLTEDGGRVVQPHPMNRIFATGNTVGQGDEFGMYQGARPQSMAMLDRFNVWVNVDYMDRNMRHDLIRAKAPSLNNETAVMINKYIDEHLEAFTNSQVMQPISPRGYVAMAQAVAMFMSIFGTGNHRVAIRHAVEMTILDRASQQDRGVLKAIVERVFG